MSIVEFVRHLTPLELGFISTTLAVTLLGWYGTFVVSATYRAILKDLARVRLGGPGVAQNEVVLSLLQGFEQVVRRPHTQLNVTVLVDRALSRAQARGSLPGTTVQWWVRLVRMAISVCVVLGLLGTFSGLTLALFGVTGAIDQSAAQTGTNADMITLLLQLRSLIGGMSTAFQASVAGVFGSLVLTVISSVRGTLSQGDQVADELEHYLTHEFIPAVSATVDDHASVEFQAILLERLEAMERTLSDGLAGGMGQAARELAQASKSIARVLGQFEPVTTGLSASGQSLASLSETMATVTTEMRNVMKALQVSNELVPQRMDELRKVEVDLLAALGTLPAQNAKLTDGIDLFQSGARQLESSMTVFSQRWPTLIEEFVSRTEQALEHQSLSVSESMDRLREVIHQGQRETLDRMEDLVSLNQTTADTVNKAVVARAALR